MYSKTRSITQGAMYLAIFGAALLINRVMSFLLDPYIAVISSVMIVMYIAQYGFKNACILSFCILALSGLFGGIYVFLYTPLSVLAGLVYGYGITKDYDTRKCLFYTVIVYIVGEFLLSLVILPLFGYGDFEEMFVMMEELVKNLGISVDSNLLRGVSKISYGMAITLIGILEGVLIHLLTKILFKKFKIKEISMKPLNELKLKPIFAYLAMFAIFAVILGFNYAISDNVLFVLVAISCISGVALVAQGYIFFVVYGVLVLRKNVSMYLVLFVMLFFPYSLVILIITGFLYATGPLERYLYKQGSR